MRKSLSFYLPFIALLAVASCSDIAVADINTEIPNRNWTYVNKIRIPVRIENPEKTYTVFFNLRHTGNYKYSNIFVVLNVSGPGMKRSTERKEFRLAYPDGEWLGSGSGNLYSYQLPLKLNYKFPAKGSYTFELEHNMRDNPLREISDVGIRVEPQQ